MAGNASGCSKRFGIKLLAIQPSRVTMAYMADSRRRLIKWINQGLGVTGRLERAGFAGCPEIWFWEENNGALVERC